MGGKDWGQYDVFWLIVVCPHCCPCFHRRCLSLPLAAVVVVCQHYCHCRRRRTHCPCSSRHHHCLCSSSVSVATIPMPLFLMQLPLTFRHGRGIYQKALACMCSNILNITAAEKYHGAERGRRRWRLRQQPCVCCWGALWRSHCCLCGRPLPGISKYNLESQVKPEMQW